MKMAKIPLLNNEMYRLYTYNDPTWEQFNGRPCAPSLARHGFSYNKHTLSVICFSCQYCISLSQLNEDYDESHKKMSPMCTITCDTKPIDTSTRANVPLVDPLVILRKYMNNPAVADDQADALTYGPMVGLRSAYKLLKSAVKRAQSSHVCDVNTIVAEEKIDRAKPDFEKLRSEELRLSTYHGWPIGARINPVQLARAGFYYTGQNDRVQCVFCRGFLRNWEVGDTPDGEHRKHFPECPFLCGLDVGNILITDDQLSTALKKLSLNQTDQHRDAIPPHRPVTASTTNRPLVGRPKHPEFQEEAVRIKSFDGKIIPNGQDVKILADAGYYHVGPQDNVKCFFCDGGLKNWQPNDDPWVEHAKWFPRCGYLMSARDPEFIRVVQETYRSQLAMQQNLPINIANTPLALPTSTTNAPAASRFTVEPREIKARMDSPTVEAVLKMGYAKEMLRQAILMKLSTTGDDFPNAESLVEAVIALQERNEQQSHSIGSASNSAAASHADSRFAAEAVSMVAGSSSISNDARTASPATRARQSANVLVDTPASAAAKPAASSARDQKDDLSTAATSKNAKSNKKKKKKKKASAGAAASSSAAGDDDGDKEEEKEEDKEVDSNAVGGVNSNTAAFEASADDPEARSLVEENRQLKEAKLCKICMDADVNIVFLPCGHLACCSNCAPAIRNCAICRAYIRGTVRIFLA